MSFGMIRSGKIDAAILGAVQVSGRRVVQRIITVIDVTDRRLVLRELAPQVSVDDVRSATGPQLLVEGEPAAMTG